MLIVIIALSFGVLAININVLILGRAVDRLTRRTDALEAHEECDLSSNCNAITHLGICRSWKANP